MQHIFCSQQELQGNKIVCTVLRLQPRELFLPMRLAPTLGSNSASRQGNIRIRPGAQQHGNLLPVLLYSSMPAVDSGHSYYWDQALPFNWQEVKPVLLLRPASLSLNSAHNSVPISSIRCETSLIPTLCLLPPARLPLCSALLLWQIHCLDPGTVPALQVYSSWSAESPTPTLSGLAYASIRWEDFWQRSPW